MTRILLADDSPHAQRMGEVILREEGYEVVSVTDGETAIRRLGDVDPDLVLADALMPARSGYAICEYVKASPAHRHTRVVLTAGMHEPLDEAEAGRVRADGLLRKPFEASVMMELVRPLIESAAAARQAIEDLTHFWVQPVEPAPAEPPVEASPEPAPAESPAAADPDPERVRAAVSLALDDAMTELVDKITERVLVALRPK